jgi:hypothetical protein
MNYLTLASMIRDEEHSIQEWLTFHYIQGFEQFVIVLHKCGDKTEERIRALPFADNIRIHKIVGNPVQPQMSTFVWIAENYGHTTEWLMFCDGDEYSFCPDTDDFREVLADYEDFGGLFLNWLEYGHCNQIGRPDKLCIETYTKRAAADSWWHASGKSIVKPKELLRPYAPTSESDPLGYSFLSPHMFKTAKPTVHTDFVPVSYQHWWCSEHICHDVARCNHYRYRSLADWYVRVRRGNCNDSHIKDAYDENTECSWQQGGNWQIEDTSAVRFASRVKEVLFQ